MKTTTQIITLQKSPDPIEFLVQMNVNLARKLGLGQTQLPKLEQPKVKTPAFYGECWKP